MYCFEETRQRYYLTRDLTPVTVLVVHRILELATVYTSASSSLSYFEEYKLPLSQ